MKVLLLTNEYPPYTYGGAGVHVDYLSRELAKLMPVEVGAAFGDQKSKAENLKVTGFGLRVGRLHLLRSRFSRFSAPFSVVVDFNTMNIDADLVHCHTWYSHFGGILAKKNYGIPLVVTVHSLEPLRPWKREQLGGGYDFSVWVEKTALEMADAVIAVSAETKRDIEKLFNVPSERIPIIYNGIDLNEYRRVETTATDGVDGDVGAVVRAVHHETPDAHRRKAGQTLRHPVGVGQALDGDGGGRRRAGGDRDLLPQIRWSGGVLQCIATCHRPSPASKAAQTQSSPANTSPK